MVWKIRLIITCLFLEIIFKKKLINKLFDIISYKSIFLAIFAYQNFTTFLKN